MRHIRMQTLTDPSWSPREWLMNNLKEGVDPRVLRATALASIDILNKYHPSQGMRLSGYDIDQWQSILKQHSCLQLVEVIPKQT